MLSQKKKKHLNGNMPELVEAEWFRRFVEKHCLNKEVVYVETKETGGGAREGLLDDIVIEKSPDMDTEHVLGTKFVGKRLSAVNRKGKYVWFDFADCDCSIVFYFSLHGNMAIKGIDTPMYRPKVFKWPPTSTKLQIHFTDSVELVYFDWRRFSRIKLRKKDPLLEPPIATLARDPLNDPLPSAGELSSQLMKYKTPMKTTLLDQEKVFCGLGNWLVDEILYQSAIHPATPASAIDSDKADRILKSMNYIIHTALKLEMDPTRLPQEWLVTRRSQRNAKRGAVPVMHDGNRVIFETHGGRKTAIVPNVQTLDAVAVKQENGTGIKVESGDRSGVVIEGERCDDEPPRDEKVVKKRRRIKRERSRVQQEQHQTTGS